MRKYFNKHLFLSMAVALAPATVFAADAAKGLTEGSPVIVELENRASEKVSEIREYMQKKITEQFGATALQVPLSARIVTVQKAI